MGLKDKKFKIADISAVIDKIRPKWDWKAKEGEGEYAHIETIKSDQNGIERL